MKTIAKVAICLSLVGLLAKDCTKDSKQGSGQDSGSEKTLTVWTERESIHAKVLGADSSHAPKKLFYEYGVEIKSGVVIPITRDNLYLSMNDLSEWTQLNTDYETAANMAAPAWSGAKSIAINYRDTLYTVTPENLLMSFDGLGYIKAHHPKRMEW